MSIAEGIKGAEMIRYKVQIIDDDWAATYDSKYGMDYIEFRKQPKPILINWDKMHEALKLLEEAYNE